MTRILVQRGSTGSSSNQTRPSAPAPGPSSSAPPPPEEVVQETGSLDDHLQVSERLEENDESVTKSTQLDASVCLDDKNKVGSNDVIESATVIKELCGLRIKERQNSEENDVPTIGTSQSITGRSHPPPPPVPPPKPSAANSSFRRTISGCSNAVRIGSSRRAAAWPLVSARAPQSDSRPSSPRSYGETDGYNSADEQNPCFGSARNDAERERQFELDIRRAKGFEVKRMLEDGNCLFRAVADQVYGDTEAYDLTRQMCIDYMERERDHFSQFITEGFVSYCKRKRRDKVYGNNVEIQALSEMYNRPIHIYSYSTEPINIFHGSYNTDVPPIRLSYHHGNHYNSLVDPRRLTIGAGLGFSCLQGANVDKDQVKAAIIAQQDQQINNALLAEGRYYSDLELTEKEMEQMVMNMSRAEYITDEKLKLQPGIRESSTSGAEPSSSGTTTGSSRSAPGTAISSNMQVLLSMGFTYLQVVEAYSIFGDDLDSMVCYLLETGSSRRKGKQTEQGKWN